jgi:argonaute-like protein implicated in RNA metabolism and viral defense
MKLVYTLLLSLTLLGASFAQDKKEPTATTTAPIKVSKEAALNIRDAQVKMFNIIQQVQKIDEDAAKAKDELGKQGKTASDELNAMIQAAYAEAKVDPKEYLLDDRTWQFVKRPAAAPTQSAPPQATPAPAPVTVAPSKKIK